MIHNIWVIRLESSAWTVQDPSDVGMSGSVTGRGPVTGYDPPVQSYNGDYIPSLSSQFGYPHKLSMSL